MDLAFSRISFHLSDFTVCVTVSRSRSLTQYDFDHRAVFRLELEVIFVHLRELLECLLIRT